MLPNCYTCLQNAETCKIRHKHNFAATSLYQRTILHVRMIGQYMLYYREQLCCHWSGVHDVHSGLSHLQWWVGTTKGGHDILSHRRIHAGRDYVCEHLTEALPVNRKLYITLQAINKAGTLHIYIFFSLETDFHMISIY